MATKPSVAQKISINLPVGAWVVVLDDIDIDESERGMEGFAGTPVFEGKVAEYNPVTCKLRFENRDIGYRDFVKLLDSTDGVQVIRE